MPPTEIFFHGGLNEQDDFHVSPEECIVGENFFIDPDERSFRPRKPQDLRTTTENAGTIYSILQLIKRNNSETTLLVSDDIVYSWMSPTATTTVGTVTASRLRSNYWSLDDFLTISDLDLNNNMYKWDGTTFGRLHVTKVSGATQTVASLTSTGLTASATVTSHGYSNGDLVTIYGANETDYNGEFEISGVTTDTFAYTMLADPVDTATGTILVAQNCDIKAKYSITWQGRVWLFNVDVDGIASPHMILASAFEDAEDYDNGARNTADDAGSAVTANLAFFMLSRDLRPINGVALFFDTLVFSTTNGRLFRITGTDATNYRVDEFYVGSGAVSEESMANIGNDILYVRQGGNMDLLSSTEKFGDLAADDVSRWVQNTSSTITEARTVYDRTNQKVYVIFSGKMLVLDKTALFVGQGLSPWSLYTTKITGGFKSNAEFIKDPDGAFRSVFWGDAAGNIYDLNGVEGNQDAGSFDVCTFRTAPFIELADSFHDGVTGRLHYNRRGELTMESRFTWSEEYNQFTCDVPLKNALALDEAKFFGGESPQDVASLVSTGITATATVTSHGYMTGDAIKISGADQDAYNGTFTIFSVTTDTFLYTMSSDPADTATGTITALKGNALFFSDVVYFGGVLVALRQVSTVGMSPPGRGFGFFFRLLAETSVPFTVYKVVLD